MQTNHRLCCLLAKSCITSGFCFWILILYGISFVEQAGMSLTSVFGNSMIIFICFRVSLVLFYATGKPRCVLTFRFCRASSLIHHTYTDTDKLTRNKNTRHIFPHHYFPVAMIGIIRLHMHFVPYTLNTQSIFFQIPTLLPVI